MIRTRAKALSTICATAIFALSSSGFVSAEGARTTFHCIAHKTCDAVGVCTPTERKVTFVLSPLQASNTLTGRYTLTYDDIETKATVGQGFAVSWAHNGLHQLVPLSDTQQIWINRQSKPTALTEIIFQTCRIVL